MPIKSINHSLGEYNYHFPKQTEVAAVNQAVCPCVDKLGFDMREVLYTSLNPC